MTRISRLLALLALVWLFPGVARAATYTWDSGGNPAIGIGDGSGTWDTSTANWFKGGVDVVWPNNTTDIAEFGGTYGDGGTIALGTNLSAGGIVFDSNRFANNVFSGSGNPTLTLGSAGIVVNSNAGV